MKQITVNLYQYSELEDKAKEKARDWWLSGQSVKDWSDATTDDAAQIGLKIMGFDVGRGKTCEGKFIAGAEECAHNIEKNHGEDTETFKTAKAYLSERDKIIESAPKDEDGEWKDERELDNKLDECDKEFLDSLLGDYLILLRKDFEYCQSDDYIAEATEANEYTFTANGERMEREPIDILATNPFRLGAKSPRTIFTHVAHNEGDKARARADKQTIDGQRWGGYTHACSEKMTFVTDVMLNPAWPYIRDFLKASKQ